MRIMSNKYSGFTLIELLIVVAIIGILSSIAMVNFMNATVRAKVARNRADFAAMSTGLEMYRVDTNRYPVHATMPATNWAIPKSITTPIDYMSKCYWQDIFAKKSDIDPSIGSGGYFYINWEYRVKQGTMDSRVLAAYGHWRLWGRGPDADRGQDWGILYDPTNGTISEGDIYRSQISPTGEPQDRSVYTSSP